MTAAMITQNRDKTKARNTSIIIHLLLLLIAFFYFWTMDIKKPEKTFNTPIVVDINFKESSLSKYAHSDPGKKKAKSKSPKKVEAKQPKKVETKKPKKVETKTPKVVIPDAKPTEPTPTDPIVSETRVEDSPIEAIEEEIEIEEPELEVIPEVVEEVITEEDLEELLEEELQGEVSEEEAATEAGATGDGGTDKTDSSIEGDGGTGESSQGDGDGATSGDDGDEGVGEVGSGTGDYDGSGDGVFGRKIVKRNWRGLFTGGDQSKGKGKIAIKICVDRAGIVRYTEVLFDETTETDSKKLKQAMKAAKGYKVEKDPNAPVEQCGKIIFNLDINAFQGN